MTFERLTSDWERYRLVQDRYRQAAASVVDEVELVARRLGISVRVTGREKTPSEFLKKALRKRDEGYLEDPWAKITDKAGARAIVQLEAQVDELADALRDSRLDVLRAEDTREGDPDALRYRGLHLQVLAPEGDGERLECELQVRTEAQDLWSSVVSHRFLYKPLVQLPDEARRSLYRLVALIELFDREVSRTLADVRALPGYEASRLLELAEQQFLTLVAHPETDRELSLQVLDAIAGSITTEERPVYGEHLSAFVADHRDDLQAVLSDYGPTSGVADFRYAMFSQPECIILLERLSAHTDVASRWRNAELPESMLAATAGVWGVEA